MGALSAFYLMTALDMETWIRLLVWFCIGLVIYFSFGIRNSKLAKR
jgi:APA family basic amino acid/polyamine antiporter